MKRFAFDVGSGSLGWAVYSLDEHTGIPNELVDMGVRIFPSGRNPNGHESNAVQRREARLSRRQRDRRKKRRVQLKDRLELYGLMPPAENKADRDAFFSIDPYVARARVARGPAELYDLGRAIWHISKHRGFKSNRKAEASEGDAKKAIATATQALREKLDHANAPTYGAWLGDRHARNEPVRIRPTVEKSKSSYDFYPVRAMLEHEFDHIWRMQAECHPELTDEARDAIRDAVFFQRPLKPVTPGRCTLLPEDSRLAKWHPLAQEFLILQQVNAIRVLEKDEERPLDLAERETIAAPLMAGKSLTWERVKSSLGLSRNVKINFEGNGSDKPHRNAVTVALGVSTKNYTAPLADVWDTLSPRYQRLITRILAVTADPDVACRRLVNWAGLTPEIAARVEKVALPTGYIGLGRRATRAIVQVMRDEVVVYSEAVSRASERGLFGEGVVVDHSDFRPKDDPGVDRLPRYYRLPVLQRMIGTGTGDPDDPPEKRFGVISQPVVHVALGQFGRVMNKLIDRYGKPDEVVIESTRDMTKSADEIEKINREIRNNTKRNDAWRKELEEAGLLSPGAPARNALLKMRLWHELGENSADRVCPYSGVPITLTQLHSDEVEIDHILPFEDTFDDSPANKTVCFRAQNRIKGKKAPGDAWSGDELAAIIARVEASPGMKNKLWRFEPKALENYEKKRDFESRQLHATGYAARVLRAYAEALFPNDGKSRVWMPNGRMTALLRHRWGVFLPDHNRKSRNDYRHHALDAAVVGVIDRRMIKQLQDHAKRVGAVDLHRVLPAPPEPFEGFRDQVLSHVSGVVASHRPQRNVKGRLQEETAYGPVRDLPQNKPDMKIGNLVKRVPVLGLKAAGIKNVRDPELRAGLLKATEGVRNNDKKREAKLKDWSEKNNHRRVRLIEKKESARPVRDAEGRDFKYLIPSEIAYLDILEGSDGRWFHHATDIWAAQSCDDQAWWQAHPEATFIMRLFKNDTLQLFDFDRKGTSASGSNCLKRVMRLNPSSKRIYLAPCNEAGNFDERHKDKGDHFWWDYASISKLKSRRARRVRVDSLGRIRTVPHGVI